MLAQRNTGQKPGDTDSFQAFRHLIDAAGKAEQVVYQVRDLFKQPSVAADPDLKEQLRDLTLSLSALDQVFYAHVDSILEEAKLRPLDRTASLKRAMDRIQQIPAHIALQRMPPGGLTSLLYHFSYVLKTTGETLTAVEKASYWSRLLRKLWPVGGVVLATIALQLWMAAKRRRGRLWAMGQTGMVVAACIVVYRLLRRRNHLIARLRRLHRILLILLRIWLVTRHVFKKTNVAREASYAVLIADLDEEEEASARAIPARRLLEEASLPRDAAIWSFKTTHLGLLKVGLDLSYASMMAGWAQLKAGRPWLRWPTVLAAAGYYLLFPDQAAEHAQNVMQDKVDIDFVKSVWMQLDSPAARQLSWLRSPALATNRPVTVRGVKCHVFADHAVPSHVFEEAGPEPLRPRASAASLGAPPGETADMASSVSGGSLSSSSQGESSLGDTGRPPSKAGGSRAPLESVLFYIHGGGFVGTSFGIDAGMLANWAKQEPRLTIVYVHYTLSPGVRFPVALDEITRVYKQMRAWSRRIVVVGESAGGNLVASLSLRCVQERVRGPDALVPVYPALNLNDTPSPSRALHINDPLVPIRLLKELAASYVPKEYAHRHCSHPLVNPGLAPDRLLAGLPPTHIVVGGLDPLLDDAIDFSTRLRRLGKPVSLSVYRNLPHGFINFDFVPEARVAVQAIFELCLQSIGLREAPAGRGQRSGAERGEVNAFSGSESGSGATAAAGAGGVGGGDTDVRRRSGGALHGGASGGGGASSSQEWSGAEEGKRGWSEGEQEGWGAGGGGRGEGRDVPSGAGRSVSGGVEAVFKGPVEIAAVGGAASPLPGASPFFQPRKAPFGEDHPVPELGPAVGTGRRGGTAARLATRSVGSSLRSGGK